MARPAEQVDEQQPLLNGAHTTARSYGGVPTLEADGPGSSEPQASPVSQEAVKPVYIDTQKRLGYIFAGLALPVFLGTFDRYIVNTNYARIATEFEKLGLASWISTSFFLAVACAQPLWGKLSDITGRKPCLMTAYILFAFGSLGCGLSTSIELFIASRILQGLGAGGTSILTTITLNDIVSDRDRGTWQGYVNLLTAAGSSTGAPMGGVFADYIGWRWAFFMQLPLIAIALINISILLHLPPRDTSKWHHRARRLDIGGAILLTGAIFCLLFGIDSGSRQTFQHLSSYIPLALVPILLAILYFNETKFAHSPFLPPSSTLNRSVLATYFVNLLSYGAFSALQFYVPLFYQAHDGVGPAKTGLRMIPATIAGVSGNLVGGRLLKRTGYYRGMILFGEIFAALGIVIVILGTVFTEYDILIISIGSFMACFAFGLGLTGSLLALITNIDRTHQALLTACMFTLRALGSAAAISLTGTLIQSRFQALAYAQLPKDVDTGAVIHRVRQNLASIRDLPLDLQVILRRCYGEAIRWGFGELAILFGLAFIGALGIKNRRIAE